MILKIKDLCFKYRREDRWLLDNVNLEISKGLWLLSGKNGCGKSTLLKLIMDIDKHSKLTGETSEDSSIERPNSMIYIDKNTQVLGRAKEYDLAKYILKLNGIKDISGYKPLYNKPLREYSLGEEKLVVFNILSYLKPEIVLIDEYITNLDTEKLDYVIGLLNYMANKGSIIIVASNEEDVKSKFESIIVLEHGRIRIDKSK